MKNYYFWLKQTKKASHGTSVPFLFGYALFVSVLLGSICMTIFHFMGWLGNEFHESYLIFPLLWLPFGVWLLSKYPMIGVFLGVVVTAIGGYTVSVELAPSGGYIDAMFIYGLILFASYHFHRLAVRGLKIKFNEDVKNEVA